MKKLILLSVLAAALNVLADSDSYIYWMVANNATATDWSGNPITGTYTAKIRALQGTGGWTDTAGTLLNIYAAIDTGLGDLQGSSDNSFVSNVQIGGKPDNLTYFVDVLGHTGQDWTYFVELYNDSVIVARSDALPYSQASIVAFSGLSTPGSAWMPATFVAAPEPNSALLLLIGCAALALRRRKQTVA